ncbi:hypothetical protein NMS_0982 [Nonlabens marinus S1-08]|uniref:Uncharacterized protein n=1 Tax=Nonlabens marinus S1-08 TaxID=1454201 RepID=W8VZQ6_9FLAO|nr:hypothetical protein NMS_0982 [Nonlabens marinus S1-08]
MKYCVMSTILGYVYCPAEFISASHLLFYLSFFAFAKAVLT